MNEYLQLLLSLLGGVLLGVLFFVGLWWTVRQLASSNHVAFLILSSMLIRTAIVVIGLYFIMGDNWQRLVAGLLGFIIARIIVTRSTSYTDQSKTLLRKEGHES